MSPVVLPLLRVLIELFRRRRFVRDHVLPLIEKAAGDEAPNEIRREWVVKLLVARGLSESEARLLTEAGVRMARRARARAVRKADRDAGAQE